MRAVCFFKSSAVNPTDAQAKAGNYKKRKIPWHGLTISIENEAGSIRSGRDPGGSEWHTKMRYAYGYINRTMGVDDDPVDCYLGPDLDAPNVYVVHQRCYNDWDKFDEDKVMIGFASEADAKKAYLLHYNDTRFLGPVTAMPVDEFCDKVKATKEKPAMLKSVVFVR